MITEIKRFTPAAWPRDKAIELNPKTRELINAQGYSSIQIK